MKKIILLIAILCVFADAYCKRVYDDSQTKCITIGFGQGGGSILGIDFEQMANERIGVQLGIGLTGYGAGINYHFKPTIRSSYVMLQYIHHGDPSTILDSYNYYDNSIDLLGPAFVFRARRWFTFHLGLGFSLKRNDWSNSTSGIPMLFTSSIGFYIPWK